MKSGRGGKRTGAGRKKMDPFLKKEPYSTRLPKWLILWLEDQDNAAQDIEDSLCEKFNLK